MWKAKEMAGPSMDKRNESEGYFWKVTVFSAPTPYFLVKNRIFFYALRLGMERVLVRKVAKNCML